MKDNKGYTLIELIICIAIISILAGTTAISYKLLIYADTQRCAQRIDRALDQLRLETMSKGGMKHYLVIEMDSEHSFYLNEVTSNMVLDKDNWSTKAVTISSKKIAGGNITISCSTDGNTSNIDTNNPCLISFNAQSGAFESIWKQLVISSSSDSSTIYLVTATGKHYIE